MPNNIEFNPLYSYQMDEYSGGAAFGAPEMEDGLLVMTEFGEFSVDLGWEGELNVEYPGIGLNCSYDKNGDLDTVSLDLETVLMKLGLETSESSPKLNLWMVGVASRLKKNGLLVNLTVNVQQNTVEVVTMNKDSEFARDVSEPQDFNAGVSAQIEVGKDIIPFLVESRGDEIVVGIGKSEDRKVGFDVLIVSKQVEFDETVMALSPKGFQKLARSILLN